LVHRHFGPLGDEEMQAVGSDSKRIINEQHPEITWEISHVVADEDGNITTFCIYQAPDEDSIRQHAAALGRHEIWALYEIGGDVAPADFPG
jgi:hypothetical protein